MMGGVAGGAVADQIEPVGTTRDQRQGGGSRMGAALGTSRQMHKAPVRQLRGEAGERQIPGATHAHWGNVYGDAILYRAVR